MDKQIREALRKNSGGMKMTELICEILPSRKEINESADTFLKNLADTIAMMPDVEILKYTNDFVGNPRQILREKEFVYIK